MEFDMWPDPLMECSLCQKTLRLNEDHWCRSQFSLALKVVLLIVIGIGFVAWMTITHQ